MTAVLTGIVLGLTASGHCAAMCGPLVLVNGRSLRRASRGAHLRHVFLYHTGRIATYVLLGTAAGWAGATLASTAFGRAAAVAGAIVLLDRALGFSHGRVPASISSRSRATFGRAAHAAGTWVQGRPIAGPLTTGAVHGLVPCGFVYAALAAAAAAGTTVHAVEVMAGFGLGTTPILVMLTMSSLAAPARLQTALKRLTPAALALAAALLLLRAFAPFDSGPVGHHTGWNAAAFDVADGPG
jgi:sulfite exporter TauE/SafE